MTLIYMVANFLTKQKIIFSTNSPPNNDNYKHNKNFSKEWGGEMEWNLVAWTLGSLLAGSTS